MLGVFSPGVIPDPIQGRHRSVPWDGLGPIDHFPKSFQWVPPERGRGLCFARDNVLMLRDPASIFSPHHHLSKSQRGAGNSKKKNPKPNKPNKKNEVGRDRKRGFVFSSLPCDFPPFSPPSPFLLISKPSDCREMVNKGFGFLSFLCECTRAWFAGHFKMGKFGGCWRSLCHLCSGKCFWGEAWAPWLWFPV